MFEARGSNFSVFVCDCDGGFHSLIEEKKFLSSEILSIILSVSNFKSLTLVLPMISCFFHIPSIRLIKLALEEFKDKSGLALNPSKSEIFFAAVPGDIKDRILTCLQFKE
jgi:hypothetical protein